jgi:hypothetical protein
MIALASLPPWNDLDRLAGLDLQCCFVAIGALSTRLPLAANTGSGPEERASGSSNARPMRVSLLSKLRPGSVACICTTRIWRRS